MLAVVDYGLGNLRSLEAALARLDTDFTLTRDPKTLARSDRLILPGVGAFADGMANIRKFGLDRILQEFVIEQRKPILGICLGFQLMAKESSEFGHTQGLGWLAASVEKLQSAGPDVRVPHIGWNDCFRLRESPIFREIPDSALFYYTHSFHVSFHDREPLLGESEHGVRFASVGIKENIVGVQFHPEKSQKYGLQLLANFVSWRPDAS